MGQRASATCNHRNKGHKLCALAWNCAGFQHKNYKDCLIHARMGLAPISAKLVSTSLVLNQTGQIQTEICAALGRLPVRRTVFSNFCCYNWNSGAEYFSSQLFVIPQGHFVVLCAAFALYDPVVLSFLSRDEVGKLLIFLLTCSHRWHKQLQTKEQWQKMDEDITTPDVPQCLGLWLELWKKSIIHWWLWHLLSPKLQFESAMRFITTLSWLEDKPPPGHTRKICANDAWQFARGMELLASDVMPCCNKSVFL